MYQSVKFVLTSLCILSVLFSVHFSAHGSSLINTIKKNKPAIVAIGTFTPTARPQNQIRGSGFAIGDGSLIVTNHHVVPDTLDSELKQEIVVFSGTGKHPKVHKAQLIASSAYYDLAVLKIASNLPTLTLATENYIDEGTEIAFTGFPIGAVLGLYPATHRGILAAVSPVVIPVDASSQLSVKMLKRLRNPYLIYQLDATAYPGNSGSALYDQNSGKVVGIINKVLVKETKEAVIEKPSGITYAIPVKHLYELLAEHDIKLN